MGQVGKIIKEQAKTGNYYGKTTTENMTDEELALFLAHQSLGEYI